LFFFSSVIVHQQRKEQGDNVVHADWLISVEMVEQEEAFYYLLSKETQIDGGNALKTSPD